MSVLTEVAPDVPRLSEAVTDDLGRVDALVARRLRRLSEIGLALSAEQDIRRLLAMILSISRELTSADGGTLYIVQRESAGSRKLYFRAAQNDSIVVDTSMSFAVGPESLAGYAAQSGETLCFDDVYELPPDAPYRFNPAFDAEHGYRTKSVLVVPLKNHLGETIGVLQLINRKRHRDALLRDAEAVETEVVGFDDDMVELAATLASQAAVALNNNLLVQEIETLFESFVSAASTAIEDRDPSTSGHSRRVTAMTLALAQAVSRTREGPYKDVVFSTHALRELRYAGLLHDFGKIGVREAILTKRQRLESTRFEGLRTRLLALRREWEAETLRAELMLHTDDDLPAPARKERISQAHAARDAHLAQLETDLETLEALNSPGYEASDENEFWKKADAVLERLSQLRYHGEDGQERPVLNPDEREALSVRRGNLTRNEFRIVQDHAQMSYEFLKRIPWTPTLENVPAIARAHHERLDGSGYPQGLCKDQIPLGARIMAIADVYDALTATDRAYRHALTHDEAIGVLRSEANIGRLDKDLLALFEQESARHYNGEF